MNRAAGPTSPETIAFRALLAVCALRIAWAMFSTGSWFVYALDDPYITFAVARNIGQSGAMFLPTGETSAPVSSLLWTLLLSPVALTGILPLVVGFVFAAMAFGFHSIIRIAGQWLATDGMDGNQRTALLLLFLLLFGAIPLEATGLEHVLHVAVCIAVFHFAREREEWTGRKLWLVLLLAFTLPGWRYESAFLLVGIGAALLWDGERRRVWQLAAASVAGAIVWAVVLKLLSGHWLSTSVIAKVHSYDGLAEPSLFPSLSRLSAMDRFPFNYLLLAANALLLLFTLRDDSDRARRWRFAAITFCVGMLLHASLGRFGWLERYEAYLLAIGIPPVLGAAWHFLRKLRHATPQHSAARRVIIAAPLIFVFANTAWVKLHASVLAFTYPTRIHAHHAMLSELLIGMPIPDDRPVALSDIGTISWEAPKLQFLDIAGLASPSVTRTFRAGDNGAEFLAWLEEREPWALIASPPTVPEAVHREYILVAEWGTRDRRGRFVPFVCFFARNEDGVPYLMNNVRRMQPRLPKGVVFREAIYFSG